MIRFAIQAKSAEVEDHLAEVVLRTSHKLGLKFKHLGVVEWTNVGSAKFLVFQSDVLKTDALLDAIFQDGRAVIGQTPAGFQVRMANRTAKVPTIMMQGARKSERFFRGPGDPFWERQFKET